MQLEVFKRQAEKMQIFHHINIQRVPPSAFLVAFFSFLRISNLVPYSLADLHSDKAYFLKQQDVSFTTSGAALQIYRTKTIQFCQCMLEIPVQFIPNSVMSCHSVTELPGSAKPKAYFIGKMALDTKAPFSMTNFQRATTHIL